MPQVGEVQVADVRGGDGISLFEKSRPGRLGLEVVAAGVDSPPLEELLRGAALRQAPPPLPEVSEPQVVRHYTRLSRLNHSVDSGFYPLGSCTMKHNPKLNEEVAALSGFASLHPYQAEADCQGVLRLLWELEQALLAITGMERVTLQPAAGAHGELAGILMIKAYHRDHGGDARDTILVPDSAHGTNLATASMAGYRVVELPSSDQGLVDLGRLRTELSERTAALMLTNPNTLGLFEPAIVEISRMVHDAGGLVYYDGANLNAIMGKVRPGDMGMDAIHVNVHKTFSTPHGGGGPGAGPVAVKSSLEPYLPGPLLARRTDGGNDSEAEPCRPPCRPSGAAPEFYWDTCRPSRIGRIKGFHGNAGVLLRAYAYIVRMGGDGLERASEDAVLGANYLRARLQQSYDIPYGDSCMHEFVASASRQRAFGVSARDIAKRILDFGMHAPTVYFPLNVPEALMVEPTETEDLATLDAFVEVMERIATEADRDPQMVLQAPHTTPVRRPDETLAARSPVLKWSPVARGVRAAAGSAPADLPAGGRGKAES